MQAPRVQLDAAFARLYNFDFKGTHEAVGQYLAVKSADPMAHAVKAVALLFAELGRMNVFGGDFLSDDGTVTVHSTMKLKARREFLNAVSESRRLAEQALSRRSADRNALLAMCLAAGAHRDFTALIEQRLSASMESVRESTAYAFRLLDAHPRARDAYAVIGFSEYLIGSLPIIAGWFVRVDGIRGDKRAGLQQLELAAASGHHLKPFAQLMLATFYRRENRPEESRRLLEAMAADYPENKVVRIQLKRLGR